MNQVLLLRFILLGITFEGICLLFIIPLPIESISLSCIDSLEFLLQVRRQMDAGVEIFPDESVVLHILDIVLLGDIASSEVPDTIH